MEAAGVGLAIVATIDLCLKYGEKLVEVCKTYKHAEAIMEEKALRVEACWYRARAQMIYIRGAHHDFDQELTHLQSRMFGILETKLKIVTGTFNELHNGQHTIKKWKVAASKECLEQAVTDLEAWLQMFDPSWMVILKVASRTTAAQEQSKLAAAHVPTNDARTSSDLRHALRADQRQSTSVLFANDPLVSAKKSQILHSSAQLAQEPNDEKQYIVEPLVCVPGTDVNTLTRNIRTIASKLQTVDPVRFGILQCKGVIRHRTEGTVTSFELVFRHPPEFHSPKSFRTLINSDIKHSLTERLKIAQQLARAVCYVHTLDFVHKNVRPESMIAFQQDGSTRLGSVFLFGFQRLRAAEGQTRLQERSSWDIDLYRHPDRQGEHLEKAYVMQHDIYSLGACLLEIGLWSSFVEYDHNGATPGSVLGGSTDVCGDPKAVKDILEDLARESLPCQMGDKYATVVLDCLTCLDMDNPHFADHAEFEDADGVLIGVRYIEKILLELESISL